MNLVLFSPDECERPLPRTDPRARHILEVLRREPGEPFDCGLIEGPRGRGVIESEDTLTLTLAFSWAPDPPRPLLPITVLVGMPRPQTARKILGEATTLGVERLVFFGAERGERSYGDSSLWTSGEVRRLLIAAAEQSFCTRLPVVERHATLDTALAAVGGPASTRLALDNYEAAVALPTAPLAGTPACLAIGPERGWSSAERTRLRAEGFILAHLGTRVLRAETACTAGLAVLKSRLDLW